MTRGTELLSCNQSPYIVPTPNIIVFVPLLGYVGLYEFEPDAHDDEPTELLNIFVG